MEVRNTIGDNDTEFKLNVPFHINSDHQVYQLCKMRILSGIGIKEKFALNDSILAKTLNDSILAKMFYKDQNEFTQSPTFSVIIPINNSDFILQLLSVLDDTITLLKKLDNTIIDFTMIDVIRKMGTFLQNSNNPCAMVINQLIALKANCLELSTENAILLLYCFNPLRNVLNQFDNSVQKAFDNLHTPIKMITSIIDEVFSEKKIKTWNLKKATDDFLKRVKLWPRIKLYSQFLGEKFGDDASLHWASTRWKSLRDSIIACDGTDISINIAKESTFNHDHFNKKLNKLITFFDHAHFKTTNRGKDTITFTPESSKILFDQYLHLDSDAIKMALKAKNNFLFFQKTFFQIGRTIGLTQGFPMEIIQLILTYADLSLLPPSKLDTQANPIKRARLI